MADYVNQVVDQSKRVPALEAAIYHLIREIEGLKNA